MAATIKIDQAGLSAGVAGKSRTDGLDTGALVTLENTGGGLTTDFRLLWVPPGDSTAVSSLAVTGDPDIWTFSPTAIVYGSYRIECIEDMGLFTETRSIHTFGIRTPLRKLLIPAFNERADYRASLILNGAEQIALSENNADDFSLSALNSLRYTGSWRAYHEMVLAMERLTPLSSQPFSTLSIVANAITLNLATAGVFTVTLTANVNTVNLTNLTAGQTNNFTLRVQQDVVGGRSFTPPASWRYPSADGAYVVSSGASEADLLKGISYDGGTTWLVTYSKDFS